VAVERLGRLLGAGGPEREECRARVVEAGDALLCRPQTYMNRSGAAVRCLVERYELRPEAVLVIYDEVALPLGRLRIRAAGGPGGHRGMESIVEALGGEEIPRLRLGVGPVPAGIAEDGLAEFVLAPFLPEERSAVEAVVERAADAARLWLESGIGAAMNRVNAPDLPPGEPKV
jgi:PTH1 family peptidyl-tRNA hydrolase